MPEENESKQAQQQTNLSSHPSPLRADQAEVRVEQDPTTHQPANHSADHAQYPPKKIVAAPKNKYEPLTLFERQYLSATLEAVKISKGVRKVQWLTLGAAMLAAFFIWGQVRTMVDQTIIAAAAFQKAVVDSIKSDATIQEQLATAQQQANAADDSVSAIREQMRQEQRAWVGAASPIFVINAKELKVKLAMRNTGKSPAINVTSNMDWIVKPKGERLKLSDIVYRNSDMENGTVFPGVEINLTQSYPRPLPLPYLSKFTHGEMILYAFARIKYRDIFNISHWTHYCGAVDQEVEINRPCGIYQDTDPYQNRNNMGK